MFVSFHGCQAIERGDVSQVANFARLADEKNAAYESCEL
jgi:hypothetical protein